ncbi:MAG: RCC1 domain-containing protein [Proteobacteria bacterium]|nr:RCC1 domain-containing protein [Pseudomonadota bacterium]
MRIVTIFISCLFVYSCGKPVAPSNLEHQVSLYDGILSDVPNGLESYGTLVNPKRLLFVRNRLCALHDLGVQCFGSDPSGLTVFTAGRVSGLTITDYDAGCLIEDGVTKCFGNNRYGQLNVPSTLNDIKAVSAGGGHTCTLGGSKVKCWGYADNYQTNPPTLQNPKYLTSGGHTSCALDDSGLKCWGRYGMRDALDVPNDIKTPEVVSIGYSHACALEHGKISCWGDDTYGQIGVPLGISKVRAVSVGFFHSCALTDSNVVCWGLNSDGQTIIRDDLKNPSQISAGFNHTCVIDGSDVKCWGRYYPSLVLQAPKNLRNPRMLTSGNAHSCVLDDDGVHCWGENFFGVNEVPQGLKNVSFIASGAHHACAADDSGLKCWGENTDGQATVPRDIVNPIDIGSYDTQSCVLDEIGVQCWGRGFTVPPQDLINPSMLAVSRTSACVVDGTSLKCWGRSDRMEPSKVIFDDVKSPKQLVSTERDEFCLLDAKGIRCGNYGGSGENIDVPYVQQPGLVSLLPGGGCAANFNRVGCWGTFLYSNWESKFGDIKAVAVNKAPFRTCMIDGSGVDCRGTMANPVSKVTRFKGDWAGSLAGLLYGDKRELLNNIQTEIASHIPSRHRSNPEQMLMVMLLNNWIHSIETEAIQRDVIPTWDEHRAHLEKFEFVHSAAGIQRSQSTLRVAVGLLNAAFASTKQYLTAASQRDVDHLRLLFGSVLAHSDVSHADQSELVNAIQLKKSLLNEIDGSERLHPTRLLIADTAQWLTLSR